MADAVPMTTAAHGLTKPAAGVMVARPAMAPTQTPTKLGLPSSFHSMTIQTSRATDAEISVFINA